VQKSNTTTTAIVLAPSQHENNGQKTMRSQKKNDAYSIVPGVDIYTKKEIGCRAHGPIVIPTCNSPMNLTAAHPKVSPVGSILSDESCRYVSSAGESED
jgi:hypothetical protein